MARSRTAAPPNRTSPLNRTWLAIANLAAGSGRATKVLRTIEANGEFDLHVHTTRGPRDASNLARELDTEGSAGLIVIGGDGTVHEVVQGLLARPEAQRLPIGVLPGGTGDALARDLGLLDPGRAISCLLEGHTRSIDLARVLVDGVVAHCFSVVGWGAFASINRRAERWRWARGRRYDLAAAGELLRPGRLQLTKVAREGQETETLLGVACLTEHTGRGMRLAPGAQLDDGLVDLVEIHPASRLALALLLPKVFRGDHVHSHLVTVERLAELVVELDPGSWAVLDGEAIPARRLELCVLPEALEVFAPRR